MDLKVVKHNLKELRYAKGLLKKYKSFLVSGRYYLFPSKRAISLNDEKILNQAKVYFTKDIKSSKTTWIISKLNKTDFFSVRNKSKTALKYQALYSANNFDKVREVKLFSFDRKEILTFCTSAKAKEKQILEYEQFGKYFNMPYIENCIEYDSAYKIAMVDLVSRPSEDKALENITNNHEKFNKNKDIKTKKVSDFVSFNYDNDEKNKILDNIVKHLNNDSLEMDLPICLQHGDLSRDNLIYGICDEKQDFWWIDWEHVGERFFLYDYFFYMINTAVYFKNNEALNSFLSGECDENLKKYFKNFKAKFNPKLKKDYLIVFFLEFLKERVCEQDNLLTLNIYFELIKNILV